MEKKALARKRRLALKVVGKLMQAYPHAKCSLEYKNPLQLLIATILSAQCTDARVNMTTPALFTRYKTARDFAKADLQELQKYIRSTGFYRNKARNIKAACKIIEEKHSGKVPKTMEEMLELPGVGRKTASIVLGNSYGIIEGVPVDTHAMRISRRLGWTESHQQDKIEKDLMQLLPRKYWVKISDLFVHHGRAVCTARKPACHQCPIESLCPKISVAQAKRNA